MDSMFDKATSFNVDISSWDVSNARLMENMFDGVTISVDNYDALLNGWARKEITLQRDVIFDGGNSKYSAGTVDARKKLKDEYNWTIIDEGQAP